MSRTDDWWIVGLVVLVTVVGSTGAVAVPTGGLAPGSGPVERGDGGSQMEVADRSLRGPTPAALDPGVGVADAGYRPNETGPTDGPNVSVDWAVTPGGTTTGPAVADGQVFVGTAGNNDALYAYDAATWSLAWEFDLGSRTGANFQIQPVVADGRVYAVASDRFDNPVALYAIDAASGTQLWEQAVSGGTTRPEAAGGRVYYDAGGTVFARAGDTGQEVWNRSFGSTGQVTVAGGQVYVPTGGNTDNLTALSATDGSTQWARQGSVNDLAATADAVYAARNGDVVAYAADGSVQWNYTSDANGYTRVLSDTGRVYVATTGAPGVTALSASDGARDWRTTTNTTVSGAPVVTDAAVYAGTSAGRVRALAPSSGDVLWTRVSDGAVGGPAVAGDRLFVGGSQTLRAYDDTGARLPDPSETADNDGFDPDATGPTDGPNVAVDWELTPGGVTTGTAIANGRAFVGTANGNDGLYAYNLTTGSFDWEFDLNSRNGQNFLYRPTVADGTVYAIAGDGFGNPVSLYAVAADSGTIRWETSVDGSAQPPVASERAVYVADNDRVRAFDPQTGSEAWRFQLEGGVRGPPVVSQGRLFVGTNRQFSPGVTYAINAETGGGLWRVADGGVRGVAARDGTVIVAQDDEVVARDAATGTVDWRHDSSADTFRSAAIDGDFVYVVTAGSSGLSALNRSDGTLQWRESLDRPSGRPTVTGDGVYLGAETGRVYGLSRAGALRWTRVYDATVAGLAVGGDRVVVGGSQTLRAYDDSGARLPDPSETAGNDGYDPDATGATDGPRVAVDWELTPGGETTGATVANGRAYVGTANGNNNLYAYDLTTGSLVWNFSLTGRNGQNFIYRPTVADGTVYAIAGDGFNNPNTLYAVDAGSGTIQWQTSVVNSVERPVASGRAVYVADNNRVRAFDPQTGSEAWRFQLTGGIRGPPAVSQGRLFVGTNRQFDPGITYAINAETGGGLWQASDLDVRGVAARDGTVYAATDSEVVARDAATGAVDWRHDSSASTFTDVSADGGRVYTATTGAPGVTALNASTGLIDWRRSTDTPTGRPVVTGDGVYVGADSGRVYGLSRGGDLRWTRVSDTAVPGPAVGGDRVVVGGSQTLRTYDDSGARLPDPSEAAGNDGYDPASVGPTDNATLQVAWNRSTPASGTRPVAVDGDTAYVGTYNGDNRLFAYNLTTGDTEWNFSLNNRNGRNFVSQPTVADGTVYVIAGDGFNNPNTLYAVDADTGTERWQTSVVNSVERPVASEGTVYVADNNRVRALDPQTGSEAWRFQLTGGIRGPPAVSQGRLFVGTNRQFDPGFTYAINAETGGGLWRVSGPDVRGVAARDGTVYAATDSEVIARDAATGAVDWRHDGSANTFLTVSADDDRVYAATSGTTGVSALNATTGVIDWREQTSAGVSGRVTLARGGAFVGTTDGTVLAENRTTGDPLWTRSVGTSATRPAVAGTTLVVANGTGGTTAYEGSGTGPPVGPSVSFVTPNATVAVDESVTFRAGASDPDGSVASIEWDLDGDGTVDATGTNVSTRYATVGEVEVTVTATDDDGRTASQSTTVVVEAGAATPPSVTVTASNTTVGLNETVQFEANATDPDGNVTAVEWDLDGDGTVDATGTNVSTSYANAGRYTVTATVTDDNGLTANASVTVTVEAPTMTPPSVTVTASNTTVGLNETVQFEANATDPDGSVASIEWDLDGDGTVDATGTNVSTSYGSAGQYTVTATVTDDVGLTANGTVSVTVESGNPFGSKEIPGGTAGRPPTDPDGDGKYEDIDGDGEFTFVDVIEFVFAVGPDYTSQLSSEQVDALNFDSSDAEVNFVDVIDLVFQLG
jgi:outer membrane protein assembly factor BamB